jgi:hypothetical protein
MITFLKKRRRTRAHTHNIRKRWQTYIRVCETSRLRMLHSMYIDICICYVCMYVCMLGTYLRTFEYILDAEDLSAVYVLMLLWYNRMVWKIGLVIAAVKSFVPSLYVGVVAVEVWIRDRLYVTGCEELPLIVQRCHVWMMLWGKASLTYFGFLLPWFSLFLCALLAMELGQRESWFSLHARMREQGAMLEW